MLHASLIRPSCLHSKPRKPKGAFGLRPKTTIVPTSLALFKDAGGHSLATKRRPTVLNSARVRNSTTSWVDRLTM